jgi:hypothetical protein
VELLPAINDLAERTLVQGRRPIMYAISMDLASAGGIDFRDEGLADHVEENEA